MVVRVKRDAIELAIERISNPDEQEWITERTPDDVIDIEQVKKNIREKYGYLLRKS